MAVQKTTNYLRYDVLFYNCVKLILTLQKDHTIIYSKIKRAPIRSSFY